MQPSTPERGAEAVRANPHFAFGQLARAYSTGNEHQIRGWFQVLEGILQGRLQVGSRTPVAQTPAWVTLEVLHGGFASGNFVAAGALQPHEVAWLARLPGTHTGVERAALNSYFLSDGGIAELQQMLESGCYRVQVPEEGALLVVAWLIRNEHVEQARALLDEIGPYLTDLRFYPVPESRPLTLSATVHLKDVGGVIADLQAIQPSLKYQRQRESIEVWAPLYDRIVDLFVETVHGPIPTLVLGPDGRPQRTETGKFVIVGGWPCQQYPVGWADRARTVLADYRQARATHRLCSAPDSATSGLATLRRYLERCVAAPQELSGRDVGMIRSILAGISLRSGLPSGERREIRRAHQARQLAHPTNAEFAAVLCKRLEGLPREQAVNSIDEFVVPIAACETLPTQIPVGAMIPDCLTRVVRRCLDAPVDVLVQQGVLTSAEMLAIVLPQMASHVRAADFTDPVLRRLYGAVYTAFRRRRSLLLLNLESQVKLEELPWVRAMIAHRQQGSNACQQARAVLDDLVTLTITAFPHQILPNKLLQEVRSLADGAGLRLPIVDEIAADIFMGEFSRKFSQAACVAAKLLKGTLYERYYGVSFDRVISACQSDLAQPDEHTSPHFSRLCIELAGVTDSTSWSVARNGQIIEQEQILTTHNLAVLFESLGLNPTLRPHFGDLATRCFTWVRERLRNLDMPRKAQMRAI